jgi:hypothetical protein
MNHTPIKNTSVMSLKKAIDFKNSYILALRKRLVLIKKDYSLKSEYEKNEIEIITFQTLSIIGHATRFIQEKKEELNIELNQFYSDLEELDSEYEKIIELAKKKQSDDITLKHILYQTNWKYIEDNIDEKIKLFKNLKDILS